MLAVLKEREPRYINIRRKLENRPEGAGLLTPRQAAVLSQAGVARRRPGGVEQRRARPPARRQAGVLRPGRGHAARRRGHDEADVDDDDGEADAGRPDGQGRASGSSGSNGGRRAVDRGVRARGARRPGPARARGQEGRQAPLSGARRGRGAGAASRCPVGRSARYGE